MSMHFIFELAAFENKIQEFDKKKVSSITYIRPSSHL